MSERLEVSIIIVSWNVQTFLAPCLESIPPALEGLAGEIFVVDNASTDSSAEISEHLAGSIPNLTVIRNTTNRGYAKANNQALRQARGEYILLLNPDTQLKPDAIKRLVACARKHQAGIVGARHKNPNGSLQPSVRRLPTPTVLIGLMLKLHRLLPALPMFRRYFAHDFEYTKTQPAEQVAGSCLLISRASVEKIGLLDERFNLWFEEVDWCQRAKTAGRAVWYCAEAELTHVGGQSFAQLATVKRQRTFNRSLRQYVRKHFGWRPWLEAAILSPLSLIIAAATSFAPKNS